MSLPAEVAARSLGYALSAGPATRGVVHSVFRHAVNVSMDGEMWTLLAEGKSDLPFGIRVALPDFAALGLRRGEPVQVRPGFVGIGSRLVVDWRTAARWVPAAKNEIAHGLRQRLAVVTDAVCGKAWSGSAEMAQAVKSAMHVPATLRAVLAGIVGCGPGATPSGDDVLVGILAVVTAAPSVSAPATAILRRALLPLLPTTADLSEHLLRQAARGQIGRDLHELIQALAGDTAPEQLREAARRVVETGATSGADTCEGLLAFAPSYFIQHQEMAAA